MSVVECGNTCDAFYDRVEVDAEFLRKVAAQVQVGKGFQFRIGVKTRLNQDLIAGK